MGSINFYPTPFPSLHIASPESDHVSTMLLGFLLEADRCLCVYTWKWSLFHIKQLEVWLVIWMVWSGPLWMLGWSTVCVTDPLWVDVVVYSCSRQCYTMTPLYSSPLYSVCVCVCVCVCVSHCSPFLTWKILSEKVCASWICFTAFVNGIGDSCFYCLK